MKLNLKVTGILIVVAVVIGLVTFLNRVRSSSTGLVQEVKRDQNPIRVQKIRVADLTETLRKSGSLEAIHDVVITSEVAGKVRRVVRDLGDVCKKNALLVQLDTESYRIALLDAEAGLKASGIDHDQRQRDLKRAARLAQRSAISAQTLERSQTAVKSTDALVRRAEAAVKLARRNLREASIRCPFSGVVAMKMVGVGQLVSPQTPLARLVDNTQLKLSLAVSAAELARLRIGQVVKITAAFLAGEAFEGKVERLGVAADQITRTFPVEILISGEGGTLKPGQIVQASIRVAVHAGAIAVPGDAVLHDAKGAHLFIAEGDKARRVTVQAGPRLNDLVIILSGLSVGQEAIVVGHNGLKEGDSVEKISGGDPAPEGAPERGAPPAPAPPGPK